MLITFAAALALLAQWMTQEEKRAARLDRQPSALEARRLEVWETAWARRFPSVGVSPSTGHASATEERTP